MGTQIFDGTTTDTTGSFLIPDYAVMTMEVWGGSGSGGDGGGGGGIDGIIGNLSKITLPAGDLKALPGGPGLRSNDSGTSPTGGAGGLTTGSIGTTNTSGGTGDSGIRNAVYTNVNGGTSPNGGTVGHSNDPGTGTVFVVAGTQGGTPGAGGGPGAAHNNAFPNDRIGGGGGGGGYSKIVYTKGALNAPVVGNSYAYVAGAFGFSASQSSGVHGGAGRVKFTWTDPPTSGTIATTLSAPTQSVAAVEREKDTIAQTLFAISQSVAAVEREKDTIDQTLFAISQAITAIESVPNAIAQTLFAPVQEADAVEREKDTIEQTLFGIEQEIDAIEIEPAVIDQTLFGIEQEIDVVAGHDADVTAVIAQSFRRRFSVQLVLADIAQTFRRRLVTARANAAITTELRGFSQNARVRNVALGKHPLLPGQSGIDAPREAHQPPISNAELEFFRVKAYARGVDGMVPPSVIAQRNLTSDRLPKPRPVVKPFPQRGKPK